MVNRLVSMLILIPILWAAAFTATASETLSVDPDRNQLYQGEVLTLTVKGTMKIDINLSNLFDFDTSSLPQPDIEKVEDSFEILGQNQRYSIQTVNGEMIGEVIWTYQLAPKKSGQLTIPALTFRGTESDPVRIEVVDGSPPDQNNGLRESFIELSTDKDSVYVQEQLILSVKLFFKGNLIGGELSEPRHPNAIIESLGKQTEYARFRDGARYRVVERRYAIFPQQPGELSLPAITFEGQARDASGRLKFLRNSQQLFTLLVKEVPQEFTGNTWLPASNLTLSESGLPTDPVIETGQNLSRRLSLTATGLPGEALPPFNHETSAGLRAYPENPERTTTPTNDGLTASLVQTTALVPVGSGALTLPEIRIPWWDTKTDSQKFATLPSRTLQVQAAPGQPRTAGNQPENPEPSTQTAQATPETAPGAAAEQSAPASLWIWQTGALIFLLGWAITGFAWWYTRQTQKRPETSPKSSDISDKNLFATLCQSARAGAPETPEHLVRWVQHWYPQASVVSLAEVFRLLKDEVVEREIRRLQARAYSQQNSAESWQGAALVEALSRCREQLAARPAAKNPLPSLYPDELNAG